MIKAEELRIGNYVHSDEAGDFSATIDTIKWIADHPLKNALNPIEPIPLTEDWLERMGFEKTAGDYFMMLNTPDKHLYIIISRGKFYPVIEQMGELSHEVEYTVHLNEVEYVHTLQNLFYALCGSELTLKEKV